MELEGKIEEELAAKSLNEREAEEADHVVGDPHQRSIRQLHLVPAITNHPKPDDKYQPVRRSITGIRNAACRER